MMNYKSLLILIFIAFLFSVGFVSAECNETHETVMADDSDENIMSSDISESNIDETVLNTNSDLKTSDNFKNDSASLQYDCSNSDNVASGNDSGQIVCKSAFSKNYTGSESSAEDNLSAGDCDDVLKSSLINNLNHTVSNAHSTNDILFSEDDSFTALQNLINTNTGSLISLDKDYKMYDGETFVTVSRSNVVIDGNAHLLNASSLARILKVTGSNVTLRNIALTGGYSIQGSGIWWAGDDGLLDNVTLFNCTVPHAVQYPPHNAGAVYWGGARGVVNNTNFIQCKAISGYGSAIQWMGSDGIVNNSYFYKCRLELSAYGARTVGAMLMYWDAPNGRFLNSVIDSPEASTHNWAWSFNNVFFVNVVQKIFLDNITFSNIPTVAEERTSLVLYALNIQYDPVEDCMGDVVVSTFYKHNATINYSVAVDESSVSVSGEVSNVRSGNISYKAGDEAGVISVDENGQFAFELPASILTKSPYFDISYSGNDYYNSNSSRFWFYEDNSFTTLQALIDSSSDSLIVLDKDYKMYDGDSFICINKSNVIIDGDGHLLNASDLARILKVTGSNVTLRNIFLTGGYSIQGSGIWWAGDDGLLDNVTLFNCTVPHAVQYPPHNAGAVYWGGARGVVNNTNFIQCKAISGYGSAIQWMGSDGIVNNSYFYKCRLELSAYGARTVGAMLMYWDAPNGQFLNSVIDSPEASTHDRGWKFNNVFFVNAVQKIFLDNITFSNIPAYAEKNTNLALYALNIQYDPVEDCIGSFELPTFYKHNTSVNIVHTAADGESFVLIDVLNVYTGNVTFNIDGGDNVTAVLNDKGQYMFSSKMFNTSRRYHDVSVTFNGNDFYNSCNTSFIYDSVLNKPVLFVNGNASEDGIGTYDNPFNNLKSALDSADLGLTICILPGIYSGSNNTNLTLNKFLNITNWEGGEVIFDGENSSKIFTINSTVTLSNLIFKNAYAETGGAVTFNKFSTLINCTFINNNARYGGSVYGDNADYGVINCTFINSSAILGGGAAYAWGANQSFINSKFINCSSVVGAAILGLYNDLILNGSYFENNDANSSGGAVYKQFNRLIIDECEFMDNDAYYDGGAVYASNTTIFADNSIFKNNIVAYGGGAIHALAGNLTLNQVNFVDNKSCQENGYVYTKYLNSFLDYGNYTMVVANTSNFNGTIPSYFFLADNGWDTSIRDQGALNICWDYSTVAAVETAIKKATGIEYDISENNVKNLISKYSNWGGNREPNVGGYPWDGPAYFANSLGLTVESIDPTSAYGFSPLMEGLFHISNVGVLSRNSKDYLDNDEVKEAVMKYGGIKATVYIDSCKGYNYYNNISSKVSHGIAIVGWDDNYSKDNFPDGCPGDGAWIIKNSWGNAGKNGYYYVSYYDEVSLLRNMFYFIFNDTVRYNRVYQYDYSIFSTKNSGCSTASWYKNTYVSVKNESLTAFSSYFVGPTNWEAEIYVNDELKHTQNGSVISEGYFTFNFDKVIQVSKGDNFTIVLKVDKNRFSYVDKNLNSLTCGAGVSYYSADGINWIDLDNENKVACLKVFTQNVFNSLVTIDSINNVTYNTSVIVNFNVDNRTKVNAVVVDEKNNVIVNMSNISGNQIILSNLAAGNYSISIINEANDTTFENTNCADFTVNKANSSVIINTIPDINYGNSFNVDFEVYNKTVINCIIKNESGDVIFNKTLTGDESLTVPVVDAGEYVLTISNEENQNYSAYKTSCNFKINKINSTITAEDFSYNWDSGNVSINYSGASNVSVNVAGHSEAKISISDKMILISNLTVGSYTLNITTVADKNYNSVSKLINFDVLAVSSTLENIDDIIFDYNELGRVTVSYSGATGVKAAIINHNDANVTVLNNEIIISNLNAGDYILNVSTVVDENHTSVFKLANVKVNRADANLTITLSNSTYPDNVTITIKSKVDGKYSVNINGTFYDVIVNDGIGVSSVKKSAGIYNAGVNLTESLNYNDCEAYCSFKVDKNDKYSYNVSPLNNTISYGDVLNISAFAESDATGDVNFIINNKTVGSTNINGYFTLPLMDAGVYDVNASYAGDSNYGAKWAIINLTVKAIKDNMTVTASNYTYGANTTVNATVKYTDASGKVAYYINNKKVGESDINGNGFVLSGLSAGNYTVTAVYSGDVNYEFENVTFNLNVMHAGSSLSSGDVAVNYGEDILIEVTSQNATKVSFHIYDEDGNIVKEGEVNGNDTIKITKLDVALYTINLTTCTDENHSSISKQYSINVYNAVINATVEVSDVIYPDNLTLKIITNVSGSYMINISNTVKEVNLTANEEFKLNLGILSADSYNITLISLIKNHYLKSLQKTVNVYKASADFDIAVDSIKSNENATVKISITDLATGNVTVTLNNTTKILQLDKEDRSVVFENLSVGNYTVYAKYNGDNNHNESSVIEKTFNVTSYTSNDLQKEINEAILNKRDLNLTHDYVLEGDVIVINESIRINGNGFTIDAGNSSGIFNITSDNVVLANLVLTNAKNSAVIWSGNNGVLKESKFIKNSAVNGGAINWSGNNASIENSQFINNSAENEGGSLLITGNNAFISNSIFDSNNASAGGAISFNNEYMNIINSTFNNNSVNGSASAIAADYNSHVDVDNHTKEKSDVTVDLKDTTLTVLSVSVADGVVSIRANVSSNNYDVDGGKVFIIIDSNCCESDVINGSAELEINNLTPGSYNKITVNYTGSQYYRPSHTNISFEITQSPLKIINSHNLNVCYLENAVYSVNIVNSNNKAVSNIEVTFIINNRQIKVKTNNAGYAAVNINLKPGTYTVKAVVGSKSVSNTVVVKNIIDAKKTTKVKKSSKKTIVFISLKGHDVKLSKKVKFTYKGKNKVKIKCGVMKKQTVNVTFKGKTYKVKVNKKGVGKLKLPKKVSKKLKKGKKYKTKVNYIGSKIYKKAKLTVKFNGKSYHVKTNKNSIAKFKITKKMVKKIKKGKKLKYTVSYMEDVVTKYIKIK